MTKWQQPDSTQMENGVHNSRKMLSLRVSFTLTHLILVVVVIVVAIFLFIVAFSVRFLAG